MDMLAHLPGENEDAGVRVVERDEGRRRDVGRRASDRPQGLGGVQVQLSLTATAHKMEQS